MRQQLTDTAAEAYLGALIDLADAHPDGRTQRGADGTQLVQTAALIPSLNGVFVPSARPDLAEIDRLAALMAAQDLPWSIVVRGEPTSEVLQVAAKYHRTTRTSSPFMVCPRAEARLRGPREGAPAIRTISSAELKMYNNQLSRGFGAPLEVWESLLVAPVIDAPWATAYMAELDGLPVATALGARSRGGDSIGVFNISTAPQYRSHGYGRLVTERVMTDGFDAGAGLAYLIATSDGMPLYESIGFRITEHWTYLGPSRPTESR